ncbi:hypothetical protein FACS1894170_11550 [Planctomycetales bacterium]|nr:hypothetical protein FACS1894170_11550 [Planctomycetales bacterium]
MNDTIFPLTDLGQDSFLIYLEGFSDFDHFDTPQRGYRTGVYLKHREKCYPLCFYTPVVLIQDMEYAIKWWGGFIAEYGMVIIDEVTLENMIGTTIKLFASHYFDKQKSYTEEEIRRLLDPFDKVPVS